jgi:7-cyano-7-deazaguanine synthase
MRAVVLLSGGLDSTVCLKKAVDECGGATDSSEKAASLLALTFDYGHKAAKKEIAAARKISRKLKVKHHVVSLSWLGKLGKSALVVPKAKVPKPRPDANRESLLKAARKVWIPNRNGVFVNIGAAFAEALGFDTIIAGFNRDEADFFPDNTIQYIAAANAALRFSTLSKITLESHTASLSKKEIVKLGRAIDAPLELVWYCYLGGQQPCGRCQSCLSFKQATETLK